MCNYKADNCFPQTTQRNLLLQAPFRLKAPDVKFAFLLRTTQRGEANGRVATQKPAGKGDTSIKDFFFLIRLQIPLSIVTNTHETV